VIQLGVFAKAALAGLLCAFVEVVPADGLKMRVVSKGEHIGAFAVMLLPENIAVLVPNEEKILQCTYTLALQCLSGHRNFEVHETRAVPGSEWRRSYFPCESRERLASLRQPFVPIHDHTEGVHGGRGLPEVLNRKLEIKLYRCIWWRWQFGEGQRRWEQVSPFIDLGIRKLTGHYLPLDAGIFGQEEGQGSDGQSSNRSYRSVVGIEKVHQPSYRPQKASYWSGLLFLAAGYLAFFWSGGVFGMGLRDRALARAAFGLLGMAAAIAMLGHGFGILVG
jgi:hypothetical protein